jgi:hypothetical protein
MKRIPAGGINAIQITAVGKPNARIMSVFWEGRDGYNDQ